MCNFIKRYFQEWADQPKVAEADKRHQKKVCTGMLKTEKSKQKSLNPKYEKNNFNTNLSVKFNGMFQSSDILERCFW